MHLSRYECLSHEIVHFYYYLLITCTKKWLRMHASSSINLLIYFDNRTIVLSIFSFSFSFFFFLFHHVQRKWSDHSLFRFFNQLTMSSVFLLFSLQTTATLCFKPTESSKIQKQNKKNVITIVDLNLRLCLEWSVIMTLYIDIVLFFWHLKNVSQTFIWIEKKVEFFSSDRIST
jgi:hypothetical protein